MTKFDLKKFIAENKATFYSSLSEEIPSPNPEADEIDLEDLEAAADYYDNMEESKLTKSSLRAKIKEMVLAEMNLNITDETPESEEDFLAEVDAILAEANKVEEGVWSVLPKRIPEFIQAIEDIKEEYHAIVGSDDVYNALDQAINAAEELLMNTAEINEADKKDKEKEEIIDDTEVSFNDEENIDVDTTSEVDPNVKAVQDALTQAQAVAQKLGDPKLTDQIGNTITFFTRTHVVDKGAVAESEEMEEGYYGINNEVEELLNALEYDSMDQFLQDNPGLVTAILEWATSVPEFREKMKDSGLLESKKEDLNESMFPMLGKILK